MVRSVSTLPLASFSVAVSCVVPPMTMEADVGARSIVETGAITVTVAVFCTDPTAAVMVAVPGLAPVTTPAETAAMDWSELVQVTDLPVTTAPSTSFGVAVKVDVLPTNTLALAGVRSMRVTTGPFPPPGPVPPSPPPPHDTLAAPNAAMSRKADCRAPRRIVDMGGVDSC